MSARLLLRGGEVLDPARGFKVRDQIEVVKDAGLEPLRLAIRAARMAGAIPVMVHVTNPPVQFDDILALLRSGDIVSHFLHGRGHGLLDEGGKVKEVGFMLIYFNPAFYCDVSDSWMFPSKQQRMWVTFAGGYFQLIFWGLCTIIWPIKTTRPAPNASCLLSCVKYFKVKIK